MIILSYWPFATVYPPLTDVLCDAREECDISLRDVDTGVDKMLPSPRESMRMPKMDVDRDGSSPMG